MKFRIEDDYEQMVGVVEAESFEDACVIILEKIVCGSPVDDDYKEFVYSKIFETEGDA